MAVPIVYFDESGNTGSDLLNKDQQVFILCSTDINDKEAKDLLSKYFDINKQVHFKKLKQTVSGRFAISKFLNEQSTNLNKLCLTMAFNKEYMIMCQILNYLVEPQLYDAGIDYYDEGCNIAHANMMYGCLPAFVGKDNTHLFYSTFLDMVKNQENQKIEAFYECIEKLIKNCKSDDFKKELITISLSKKDISSTLKALTKQSIDPSMAALIDLSGRWNYKFQDGFNIIHDRSNNINSQIDTLNFLRNLKIDETEVGYGDIKTKYPLNILDFVFMESSKSHTLQLCDIISSSLGSLCNSLMNKCEDEFSSCISSALSKWEFTNIINSSNNVSPDPKRKKVKGQIDPLDFLAYQMYKSRSKEL